MGVLCSDKRSGVDLVEPTQLSTGDYFGERALLLDEPRAVDVDAIEDSQCMVLDRQAFNELLGPLTELIHRNLGIRVLKSVPILANLGDRERSRCVNAFSVEKFKSGQMIMKE